MGDADDDDVQVAPTFVEDHESIDDPVMPPPPDFKNDKKEDWFDDPVLPVLPVGAAKIEHHDDKADSNTNKSEPGVINQISVQPLPISLLCTHHLLFVYGFSPYAVGFKRNITSGAA